MSRAKSTIKSQGADTESSVFSASAPSDTITTASQAIGVSAIGKDESKGKLNNLTENNITFYKELIEIFKEAPTADQNKAVELLSRMDPANKLFYDKIKG